MEADSHTPFLRIGITPASPLKDEAGIITDLLDEDKIDFLHIRHPDADERVTANIIASIPARLHTRLALHDHHDLCIRFPEIGGIHLNMRHPAVSENLALMKSKLRISRSCHSIAELANCCGLSYVTLSPIFDSISKSAYQSSFPPERYRELKEAVTHSPIPVIALGGVTGERLPLIRSLGFAGYAMLGALWESLAPKSSFS